MREIDSGKRRALAEFPELRVIEAQLDIYATLLRRWQRTVNLVGPSTIDDLWWRHFADSAQVGPALSRAVTPAVAATHVDLGAGAGFPGLVWALFAKAEAARQSLSVLVESDTRKAAFLREVSRETGAGVEVATLRAEDYIPNHPAPTVLTSRAFMPPTRQIALVRPWLEAGTTAVLLAGETIDQQDLQTSTTPSRTGPGFVLVLRRRESEPT